jgi:FkbM family methyltransferase
MSNVFILLGAGTGNDVAAFKEEYEGDWDIYAWEANPMLTGKLAKRFPDIHVVQAAAYTEDGTIDLYLGNNKNNSSIDGRKINVKESTYHSVPAINFTKWMQDSFSKDDRIVLVMDIEGAEFALLPPMREAGLIEWLDEFYMEFHGRKLEGFNMNVEKEHIEYLKETLGENVYICGVYQHEKFARLNSEERPRKR